MAALREQGVIYQRSLAEQTAETQQVQRLLQASREIEEMQRSELLEAQRSMQSDEMRFTAERKRVEKKVLVFALGIPECIGFLKAPLNVWRGVNVQLVWR